MVVDERGRSTGVLILYNGYYGRGLEVAVGPTLHNCWSCRCMNVAVGPTLGQRLKVTANLLHCANIRQPKYEF